MMAAAAPAHRTPAPSRWLLLVLSLCLLNNCLPAQAADSASLAQTDRMFIKLKQIAAGQENALAILTPTEAATLKKLNSDWAKSIDTIEKSKAVPTARVVVFDGSWKGKERLSEILLAADKDPKAAEILEEMRLKGFDKVK